MGGNIIMKESIIVRDFTDNDHHIDDVAVYRQGWVKTKVGLLPTKMNVSVSSQAEAIGAKKQMTMTTTIVMT